MTVVATLVDSRALLETVAASLIAGVGVTATFSIGVAGVALFADARRHARPAAAAGAAVLMTVGLTGTAAAIVIGIVVMTSK